VRDEALGRSRQGTVTVLALLLGLLLGYAPAAASPAELDRSAARLAKSEIGKAGAALRTGGRLQSEDPESDDPLVGSKPRPVTASLWLRTVEAPAARPVHGIRPAPSRAYQARAPPAA